MREQHPTRITVVRDNEARAALERQCWADIDTAYVFVPTDSVLHDFFQKFNYNLPMTLGHA